MLLINLAVLTFVFVYLLAQEHPLSYKMPLLIDVLKPRMLMNSMASHQNEKICMSSTCFYAKFPKILMLFLETLRN